MSLLKLVSVLLDYPQDALWQHGDELLQAAQAAELAPARRATLVAFVRELLATDSLEAQDRWLSTFDRGRAMSLLLFEHIHGESRDRGQAMVDLIEAYRKHGYELSAKELPDYLPLFLEYLSVLPPAQAADELAQPGVILSALAQRLEEKGTAYAAPMRILADLAGAGGEAFEIAPADDPDDLAALDAAWEEEQIRFDAPTAPGSADCPQVAGMVDRMLAQEPVRSHAHG